MRRSLRMFLTPGWIGLTLLIWASAVAMVFLGRWQLDVSDSKHFDAQNFAYALQWWTFSAFAVGLWLKAVHDGWTGKRVDVSTSGELAVRPNQTGLDFSGPALLVGRPDRTGGEAVVYRGYVMPQSSTSPARSDDDPVRAAYNDYLWQLGLADSAGRPDHADPFPVGARPASPAPEPAGPADGVDPPAIERRAD